jgi:hypothetical protein
VAGDLIRHERRHTMLRLETISYLLSSLLLAWTGGWLFTHDHRLALMACCAIWAALTVWLLLRSLKVLLRQQSLSSRTIDRGAE